MKHVVVSVVALLVACTCVSAQTVQKKAQLTNSTASLSLQAQGHELAIAIQSGYSKIIDLTDIRFNDAAALRWTIASVTPEAITVTGEFPAAVDYYKPVTDNEPRKLTLVASKVEGGFRLHAEPKWGRTTSLYFNYLGDHFFGLSEPLQPDNQLSPDLTGSSISVDSNSEDANLHENFASAYSAFYMSSKGYGAFFDSFARGRYDFAINGHNRISHDTGTLDWYVFTGKDGVEIQRAYFALIGAPKPVPAWGLGPIGWRDQNNGGAPEILDDVKKLGELRMPFTAWFVDRPYSDGANQWSQMNFNMLFANPAQWIAVLRKQEGLEFMSWATTATFGDTSWGKHLAGNYSYLDLTDPGTVQIFQNTLAEKQYSFGVKGHKIDRADEAFPVAEAWADRSVGIASRRNQYVYLMAKVHDEALRNQWGDDQMTFARAAWQRSQPYLSAVWGGDPRASWEGLQSNFANAMRASFIGFPVWGTDVGGYLGEGRIPQNLYLRWLQAGSMSGLFEIKFDGAGGAGPDRLPWHYDEKFQTLFRKTLDERMLLLPYLYSLSHTSGTTGTLMQPLAYRHLQDKNTWNIADEFYLGSALLIAPMLQEGEKRSVYLPEGTWVDFNNTTQRYQGGRSIEVKAPLDTIPRFVAANSIFVLGDIYKGSNRNWNTEALQLQIFATPATTSGSAQFAYVDMIDHNKLKIMTLARDGKGVVARIPALTSAAELIVLLERSPQSVLFNGSKSEWRFDEAGKQLHVPLKMGTDANVELRW